MPVPQLFYGIAAPQSRQQAEPAISGRLVGVAGQAGLGWQYLRYSNQEKKYELVYLVLSSIILSILRVMISNFAFKLVRANIRDR